MRLQAVGLPGLYVIEIEPRFDERGMFARVFDEDVLAAEGLVTRFPQHSIAFNQRAGTVRGLHYQKGSAETKIVRVSRGAIFDVAVDIREKSPTFGKSFAVRLDASAGRAMYIPAGFAHGYQTLEDNTETFYLISARYEEAAAAGIHHADPVLSISWPLPVSCISARDAALPPLRR